MFIVRADHRERLQRLPKALDFGFLRGDAGVGGPQSLNRKS
jgi:hypothetical protein